MSPIRLGRRYRNANEWVEANRPKTYRVAVVYYFRCADYWTHPDDVRDGYGEGYGWDCWLCPDSKPGLPSRDAARREAEQHASQHRCPQIVVRDHDDDT